MSTPAKVVSAPMIIGCPRNLDTLQIDYMYDESGVVFAGVYAGSDATAGVRFEMSTTDRGDVRELMDASGNSFAFYSYDAWGNPIKTATAGTSQVGAAVAAAIAARQPLRYASYAYDTESGLYYLSQRYYDPSTMQFVSKDPARADGEMSAYLYCGNDPVNRVDPEGLWGWGSIWGAVKRVVHAVVHTVYHARSTSSTRSCTRCRTSRGRWCMRSNRRLTM